MATPTGTRAVGMRGDSTPGTSKMLLAAEMHVQRPRASLPFAPEAVGAYSCRGVSIVPRSGRATAKINQDRACVCSSFAGDPNLALFGVFDGHGAHGEHVSQFVVEHLPKRLEEHAALEQDPGQALREAFVAVDDALREEKSISTKLSGTTATVCLCRRVGDTLLIHAANAGDSRAVLVSGDQADDLTFDHKPDLPVERERIEATGGHISAADAQTGKVARVWLNDREEKPGLAVARSIGDHMASRVGVFAEPEVTTRTISCTAGADEVILLMGSDGMFEFLGSQGAAEVVVPQLKSSGATEACAKLIGAATASWRDRVGEYCDDITAVVVRVRDIVGAGVVGDAEAAGAPSLASGEGPAIKKLKTSPDVAAPTPPANSAPIPPAEPAPTPPAESAPTPPTNAAPPPGAPRVVLDL